MRIVIDLQACQNGSRYRGIGRYTSDLTRALLRSGQGHEFRILLSDRFPGTLSEVRASLADVAGPENFVVFTTNDRTTSSDPANAWRCRAAELIRAGVIDQIAPDAVIVPSLVEGLWDNCVVSVEPRPYVTAVTIHDLIPLTFPDQHLQAPNDRAAYYRKLHGLRHADVILTPSDFVRGEVLREIRSAPERVVTTFEGADGKFSPATLDPQRVAELGRQFGLTRPFVLNTSPLEHRKNLEGLIAGFGSLPAATRDKHQLAIVGKMDAYGIAYLNKLALAEGLAKDQLVLTGRVSDRDLVDLYRSCALFCFPSISEGFGLPALEAMRSGAIAVGARTSSIPEVIGENECLFDPAEPAACAAVMGRLLGDPGWADAVRARQAAHAATLTWEATARKTLDALAAAQKTPARSTGAKSVATAIPNLTIVHASTPAGGRMSGYVDALAARFAERYRVTFVSVGGQEPNLWRDANYDVRDLAWLTDHGSPSDRVLYVATPADMARLEPVMRARSGVALLVDDPATRRGSGEAARRDDTRMLDLYATSGYRALVHRDEIGTESIDGADLLSHCDGLIFEETTSHLPRTVAVPPMPIASRSGGDASSRRHLDLPDEVPIVLAHVRNEAAAAALIQAFRAAPEASRRSAHLVTLSAYPQGRVDHADAPLIGRYPGRIIRKDRDEYRFYQQYLALAEAIYIAPDVEPALAAQFTVDVRAAGKPLIASPEPDAVDRALTSGATDPDGSGNDAFAAIETALNTLFADSPLTAYRNLLAAMPAQAGDCRPSTADLEAVAVAVAANERATRAPQILLDVTDLAGPRASTRLDRPTRALVHAALTARHSRRIETIRFDGDTFVYARRLAANVLGIELPLGDEPVSLRVGDNIVGIDQLRPFHEAYLPQLVEAAEHGVGCTYVDTGFRPGSDAVATRLALEALLGRVGTLRPDLAATAVPSDSRLTAMREAGIPVEIVALAPGDDAAAAPVPRDYVVTGHVLGSYSLAIINRAVAATIEAAHPGRLRIAPVETDPISDLSHIPGDERPAIEAFAARKPHDGAESVVISQHYPVLVPDRAAGDIAIALYAHEETRILPSVAETLNAGFDAVLATSAAVTKALIDSGVTVPVTSIGQPTASDSFEAMGRTPRPNRPIRSFLHVSSCFPRKGPDILLEAWRDAFDAQSPCKLVIKTFPNPHNDIEEQVAALFAAYPNTAPIEVINEDLDKAGMAALYEQADVMVLPTRGEGYNLPALEAMLARLPLIVTGHGGHLDFCSAEEARFLHYRLEPSRSHVRSALSLWADPDVGDLAHAFRQALDPIHRQAIRRRADRARIAALGAADKTGWTHRLDRVIADIERAPARRPARTAWVTTWAVQCGIAQHSEFLFEGMSAEEREPFRILCDLRTPDTGDAFVRPIWTTGEVPQRDVIAAEVAAFDADAVVIQHQDGLISWEELTRICVDPRFHERILVVVLHNPRAIGHLSSDEQDRVIGALAKATRLIVHNVSDVNLMAGYGLTDTVTLLPPGALRAKMVPEVGPLQPGGAGPVIGCHGFAFPHKGIDKLIRAAAALRPSWPNLRLRLVTAEFPDQKSRDTISGLRQLAEELDLTNAIDWHTDFLPVDTITTLLSGCDLLVLPYDQSQDSASGAARICLSSLTPTLATRVKIFEEMQDAFASADSNDPAHLARSIDALLNDVAARADIQRRMAAWLADFDWSNMMALTRAMIDGLLAQRQLGWD